MAAHIIIHKNIKNLLFALFEHKIVI